MELRAEAYPKLGDGKVASQGPSVGETPLKRSLAGYSTRAEGLRSTKPVSGGITQLTVCLRLTALPGPPQERVSPSPWVGLSHPMRILINESHWED